MKIRIMLPLLLTCGLFANAAIACRVVSKEEQAALRIKNIAQAKSDALSLRAEADLVFVGRLAQATTHNDTRPGKQGIEQLQINEVVFDRVENIKGSYADGQALNFNIITNVVEINCGLPTFRNERLPIDVSKGERALMESSKGQRFLVYAKGGTILRTNHIPVMREVLSGHEEEIVVRYTPE